MPELLSPIFRVTVASSLAAALRIIVGRNMLFQQSPAFRLFDFSVLRFLTLRLPHGILLHFLLMRRLWTGFVSLCANLTDIAV